MSERLSMRRFWVYSGVAVTVGFAIAWDDVGSPFGDDSEKFTLLLWLLSCALLALVQPHHAWRWALLVGPWVAIVHSARLALGLADSMHPPTYSTALLLIPVSLVVCLVGAYAGVFVRWAARSTAAAQEP